ncbi:MAG: Ig-like domain-containing protein, partial [Chitinophagaceae bacterium]
NTTLNVVNWNIEWFGGTPGPTDDNLQQTNVKRVLDSLDADIYAFSEIVDINRLANMVATMNGYAFTVSDYASGAPNPSSGNYASAQKMAFVYRTSVVANVTARGLLQSSATANANWSTGRVPYFMQADVVNAGTTVRYNFILLHGKANTGNEAEQLDSYNRRKAGAKELKDTLDAQFSTAKIIILGDYNDDLDSTIAPGVSPRITSYDDIVKDSIDLDSYVSISLPLSLAGLRSTASNPDVVDHVVISNEVFPDYITNTTRLVTEVESWITNYSSTTSDHYPIMSRYLFPADVAVPTLVSTDPANNAVNVPIALTLKMNFSENVQAGTGNLLVKNTSDNSIAATVNINTATFSNNQVSFTISGLSYSTSYYVEVPNTTIKDLAGNAFPGFSGATTWSFTTAAPPDVTAPTLVSTDPVNNAIGVSINPTLKINFSEAITIGTGNILIKKTLDNSVVATINVSGALITGSQASIAVTGLQPSTQYYVEVPNTAFKDLAGNAFAGFAGSATWKFITTAITGLPTISGADVELLIYPNPTSNNLVFTFRPNAGKLFYQVIDAHGKLMLETVAKNVGSTKLIETLNINKLPAGVYVIKIVNNNRLVREKFVKK